MQGDVRRLSPSGNRVAMSWFTSIWIVGGFFGFVAIVIGILFVILVLSDK